MNTSHQMIKQAASAWSLALVGLTVALGSASVSAQTNNRLSPPGPAAAAINAATAQSREPQRTAIEAALLPFTPVTVVVTPAAPATTLTPRPLTPVVVIPDTGTAEAGRVMRVPAACTPKTNSLDCVQDSTQPGQGANVEGRVRNSVMGEVGTGKATTEGGSGPKREPACTPKPGELNCTP
jgi:hypothetical protein